MQYMKPYHRYRAPWHCWLAARRRSRRCISTRAARPLQWFIDGGASITAGTTATFSTAAGAWHRIHPATGSGQPFMLRRISIRRFSATNQLIALGQP